MPLLRITVATTLVAVAQCATAPPAVAVTPPPIDSARLPGAALPAPPRPTVQREVCAVPALDPGRVERRGQLDRLDLPAVWPLTRGAGQRVAVIDTGVSPHRRLPRMVAGGDYVSAGDGTQDCDGHGTLVAGIIAATSDSDPGHESAADRFSGVAPAATVIAIRQSSGKFGAASDPSGVGVGDVDTLAKAVRTAADLGASVINISSVACAPVSAGIDDRALGAALAYAVDVKNAVVVAAAGNTGDGEACPGQSAEAGWKDAAVAVSPAWYDDYVLTVGSVDSNGAPSAFTLAGPWVDVAAPGEDVLSVSPVGDAMANTAPDSAPSDNVSAQPFSTPIRGTSYAAPVVSGLAALVRSRFPGWTPRQVMDRIKATAHHPPGGRNGSVGTGVVDPLAAVSSGASPVVDQPGTAVPAVPPPGPDPDASPPSGPRGVRTALRGTAMLFAVLVAVLVGRRSRRIGVGFAGD